MSENVSSVRKCNTGNFTQNPHAFPNWPNVQCRPSRREEKELKVTKEATGRREKERKVTTPISATSSLWLELSSLQQLTVGAILLPFLYH